MYDYVIVKCGGIAGGGGTIKQFLLEVFVDCLLIYNKSCLGIVSIYFLQIQSLPYL